MQKKNAHLKRFQDLCNSILFPKGNYQEQLTLVYIYYIIMFRVCKGFMWYFFRHFFVDLSKICRRYVERLQLNLSVFWYIIIEHLFALIIGGYSMSYEELNDRILYLEWMLKSKLDEEGLKIFLEYERLVMEQSCMDKIFQVHFRYEIQKYKRTGNLQIRLYQWSE